MPIPLELRKKIADDPFMKTCIHTKNKLFTAPNTCDGHITWEHAFIYADKQIQEAWAIVPICWYHHLGKGLNKEFNQYLAIIRADIDDFCIRMPKKDWRQIKKYLVNKYGPNETN